MAHTATDIGGKVSEGTVVAAECCYGAQLFDPAPVGGKMGICSAYLKDKAYGFWGSTTIAYGPQKGNAWADLISQYFLKRVLAGSSLGRAALEARQAYVQSGGNLDPFDLKTLAQFNLLGDPSIQPVSIPSADVLVGEPHFKKAGAVSKGTVKTSERRRQLLSKGLWLAENIPVVRRARARRSPVLRRLLEDLAGQNNMHHLKILSFDIDVSLKRPSKILKSMLEKKAAAIDGIHVVFGRSSGDSSIESKISRAVAVVAKEVAGEIVSYRVAYAK